MRRVLLMLAAVCFLCIEAIAIEPSNIVVTKGGKAYYKHKVESGQTLYALSKAYGVTEKQISESNGGLTASGLKAGSYIYIPRIDVEEVKSTDKAKSEEKHSGKYLTYEVKSGDTIYSIARKYKISVSILEQDNPTIDVERITPGMKLNIRRSESGYATTEDIERERDKRKADAPVGVGEHRVAAGETVYSLSRTFGMSEDAFLKLNGLRHSGDLKVGMIVKTGIAEAKERTEYKGGASTVKDDKEVVAPAVEPREEGVIDSLAAERAYDYFMGGEQGDDVYITPAEVAFPPLGRHHTLKVALMLPFHQKGKVSPYYVDFYRGVLIAMEDLKNEGYNIELAVFDTEGDSGRLSDIVAYEEGFHEAQLLIGPVYEAELRYVLGYAEENDIIVVSPLADIESLQSPVLFQMQAENDYKNDKLVDIFDGSREVVTIYAGTTNNAYATEMRALAAQSPTRDLNFVFDRESFFYRRNADGTNGEEVDIVELMRTKSEKAFVIVAADETNVDRILTTLSSTKSSIEGRGMTYGRYVVVGNRKWTQSRNIDHQSFFRNNAIFVVPYHAKRSDEKIRLFDGRYIGAYGVLPSMYSYRGYDAAMIFCRKMFEGIDATITDETFTPLATTYDFDFVGGHYVNTHWMREHYKNNFTIEVE